MAGRQARKRMYRTMQGRMVDIEKLRSANESVRAIGNMNVNARGDVLGHGGQIVKPKETVMKEYYEQPKGRVDDTPARARPIPPRKVPPVSRTQTPPTRQTTPRQRTVAQKTTTTKKGIDAALDGIE